MEKSEMETARWSGSILQWAYSGHLSSLKYFIILTSFFTFGRYCLERGDLVTVTDEEKRNILHWAVEGENFEIVEYLLENYGKVCK